ncbi:50S ribosomal protein L11 methyltransferase [Pseudemcibacter aquimaris]|uniref:50S ribosomal protein L11 methyltransferase n=1 Tax=Pseudemcibacter aquimaris TaxID=2857064 RepID=UPI002012A5A5|nr:50S ribosomal protein L11 methyltransferase [Pseudemcibacter aquimaris]MCC3861354.1 50S ribosomal protein L11 methyltransferase [Pseudemcibacter aquimaris]WDU58126.1 50S ribosomal protein L11 methyltransferase [Pseudemcibacter aquimaris]
MTDNKELSNPKTWKISIISPIAFLPALEEILYATYDDEFPSLAAFEIKGDTDNKLMECYLNIEPDMSILQNNIENMASVMGISAPNADVELLEEKNWVAESQKMLKPITAGKFHLYGSHDADSIPEGKLAIQMEAGQAFGTGSHETTNGCLLAISDLCDELNPASILDLGCGSGVLAIAMAKYWDIQIIASDIDPVSVETAKDNIRMNNITALNEGENGSGILAVTSDGYEHDAIKSNAPYDITVANILAKPLQMLAPDITSHLKDTGTLVLSGLLQTQEDDVLGAYKKHGWILKKRYPINEWVTLVLDMNE